MYKNIQSVINEIKFKYKLISLLTYLMPVLIAALWAIYNQLSENIMIKKSYKNIIEKETQKLNRDLGYELQSLQLIYKKIINKKIEKKENINKWNTQNFNDSYITSTTEKINPYQVNKLQIITKTNPKHKKKSIENLKLLAKFLVEIYKNSNHIKYISFFNETGFTNQPTINFSNSSSLQQQNILNIDKNLLKDNCAKINNFNWKINMNNDQNKIVIYKGLFIHGYCEGVLAVELDLESQIQRIKDYAEVIGKGYFKENKQQQFANQNIINIEVNDEDIDSRKYSSIYKIKLQNSNWFFIYKQLTNFSITRQDKTGLLIRFLQILFALSIIIYLSNKLLYEFFNKKIFELLVHLTRDHTSITSPIQKSKTWKKLFDTVTYILLQNKKVKNNKIKTQQKPTTIIKNDNFVINNTNEKNLIDKPKNISKINLSIFFEEIITASRKIISQNNKQKQIRLTPITENKSLISAYVDINILQETLSILIKKAIEKTKNGNIEIGYKELTANKNFTSVKFWIKDKSIGIEKESQIKLAQNIADKNINSILEEYRYLIKCQIMLEQIKSKIEFKSQISSGNYFYFTVKMKIKERKKYINNRNLSYFNDKKIILFDNNNKDKQIKSIMKSLCVDTYEARSKYDFADKLSCKSYQIIMINQHALQKDRDILEKIINHQTIDEIDIFIIHEEHQITNTSYRKRNIRYVNVHKPVTIYKFLKIIEKINETRTQEVI